MSNEIAVIGIGCISAIGDSPVSMLNNLVKGDTGIKRLKNFNSGLSVAPLVGEVSMSNVELTKVCSLKSGQLYSRTMLLGLYAAQQAILGLSKEDLIRACFISANTVGGMDQTETLYPEDSLLSSTNRINVIQNNDSGASTHFIAQQLGIKGFSTTISTACSSSANSIMLGARMIRNGLADIVVAGGTDALCKFTLFGFNSLMLLSDDYCQPFDQNRKGLNLGEGAAYVVLCSDRISSKYPVLGKLVGWGNANDAYHQTASSPEGKGALMAMEKAINMANIKVNQIDYVNAHGTATPNNDLAESQALISIFETPPPFSSTKSFTGHTLGASGSLEAVISLLAIQNNILFPSLHFSQPMIETSLTPVVSSNHVDVSYVLSNSFGFGGNCSSLLFKKAAE